MAKPVQKQTKKGQPREEVQWVTRIYIADGAKAPCVAVKMSYLPLGKPVFNFEIGDLRAPKEGSTEPFFTSRKHIPVEFSNGRANFAPFAFESYAPLLRDMEADVAQIAQAAEDRFIDARIVREKKSMGGPPNRGPVKKYGPAWERRKKGGEQPGAG